MTKKQIITTFLENKDKPYNLMLILGRNIEVGVTFPPDLMISLVDVIEKKIRWTPIDEFFQLFPPVKRYEDDGIWDYKSTLEMVANKFGETFGKDDFKYLLMTSCYENKFIQNIGFAWMDAISDLRQQQTGMSVMEEFLKKQ
ncbi:hypothetical protein ACUXCC_002003 [Cytobacillus horneckiae]|uniref:hypothetical protein n=1 Tax=Cytobacillus horneckiae TaxID=549687 RepID=UPI0019D0FE05|nr:hypothetical protein [Cytobacillus horneckiae]MBN6886996.1 hypothetical protein [Cytobacillus horneckiae]